MLLFKWHPACKISLIPKVVKPNLGWLWKQNQTRNAWQSLMHSPPDIAVLPRPRNRSSRSIESIVWRWSRVESKESAKVELIDWVDRPSLKSSQPIQCREVDFSHKRVAASGWRHCNCMNCVFTVRCSTVQSAFLLSLVVHPSVCLSVCDVGGSWPHRWKILETNCANN